MTTPAWSHVREQSVGARAAISEALAPSRTASSDGLLSRRPSTASAALSRTGSAAGSDPTRPSVGLTRAGSSDSSGGKGKKKNKKKKLKLSAKDRTASVEGDDLAAALASSLLAHAQGPESPQQSWKDRIKRRLSHSTEEQTEATLLKLESVCPNCKHVICSEECLDMTTMKQALKAWKRKLVLQADTLQQFSRASSGGSSASFRRRASSPAPDTASRSSSSDEGQARRSQAHSSDDSSADDRRSRRRSRKNSRRQDAPSAFAGHLLSTFNVEPAKTGTRETLMNPPPRHVVAAMDDGRNDGSEDFDLAGEDACFKRADSAFRRPRPTGAGQVVFLRKQRNVTRAKVSRKGGSTATEVVLDPFYRVLSGTDTTLVFESRFESGNLHRALKVGPYEYDLYLCTDWNTSSHVQWFYFSVANTRKDTQYRLNIVNLMKPISLYGRGLRPLLYSEDNAEKKGTGWIRVGTNICYYANGNSVKKDRKENEEEEAAVKLEHLRTLSFDVEFPASNDTCYLAHCFPYTYTDLQRVLHSIEAEDMRDVNERAAAAVAEPATVIAALPHPGAPQQPPELVKGRGGGPSASAHTPRVGKEKEAAPDAPSRKDELLGQLVMRRALLCLTIAGNRCEVVTITEPSGARDRMSAEELELLGPAVPLECRLGVVFTARVHPGESNSSWIMDGILRFLTSSCLEARRLRARFVFKIVPMLNPDGVINGNYRCGLAGHDLNRRYVDTSAALHPTVFHLKRCVKGFKKERRVGLYVDLHGHSSKPNVFVYGCEAKRCREWHSNHKPAVFSELVFPSLLEERCSIFSMADSSFKLRKSKLGTGRAVMWHEGIPHTFTLESSFGGASQGPHAGRHFGVQDLRNVGREMCRAVWDMYGLPGESNFRRIITSGPARVDALRAERTQRKGANRVESDEEGEGSAGREDGGAGSDEDSSEEASGDESSEDETIVDPGLLFRDLLDMSERVKRASENLSKGLQSSGQGKLWKDWKRSVLGVRNLSEDCNCKRGVCGCTCGRPCA